MVKKEHKNLPRRMSGEILHNCIDETAYFLFTHHSAFIWGCAMIKVFLHFTELETRSHLPPEEMEIDNEDEFDVFAFNAFLKKIGARSMEPFVRHGKNVLLSCISDEKGKLIFYNAQNL